MAYMSHIKQKAAAGAGALIMALNFCASGGLISASVVASRDIGVDRLFVILACVNVGAVGAAAACLRRQARLQRGTLYLPPEGAAGGAGEREASEEAGVRRGEGGAGGGGDAAAGASARGGGAQEDSPHAGASGTVAVMDAAVEGRGASGAAAAASGAEEPAHDDGTVGRAGLAAMAAAAGRHGWARRHHNSAGVTIITLFCGACPTPVINPRSRRREVLPVDGGRPSRRAAQRNPRTAVVVHAASHSASFVLA